MKISRRGFMGTSAAAFAATLAPQSVLGANDRIRVCVVGVNGRGGSHIDGFGAIDNVEVAALCDPDSRVLARRGKYTQEKLGTKPKLYEDIRDVLADDSIDAISIASPNHWHSLMAIWGAQAGKDVYVEKPLSHNIWEGRQLVEAVRKYDKIVMHGTQSRSDRRWLRDINLMHEGVIGEMYMAKGYTYKNGNRYAIGHGKPAKPPRHLNWDLWQGPADEKDYLEKENGRGLFVHYNWHWFWEYGNGETGNQGVHQMDLAVWGMNRGLPVKVSSSGGRYVWDDDGETPNTQMSLFTYADGSQLQFEVRNIGSYKEADNTTGNTFFCEGGYYTEKGGFFDYQGRRIAVEREHPETEGAWKNFINAVRSRDNADNFATAEQGHLACVHCHMGNIAYRVGKTLQFNPETERFIGDYSEEANKLVSRAYRGDFRVPKLV